MFGSESGKKNPQPKHPRNKTSMQPTAEASTAARLCALHCPPPLPPTSFLFLQMLVLAVPGSAPHLTSHAPAWMPLPFHCTLPYSLCTIWRSLAPRGRLGWDRLEVSIWTVVLSKWSAPDSTDPSKCRGICHRCY